MSDVTLDAYLFFKEFWGDTFGSLTDQYGVGWMLNIAAPK